MISGELRDRERRSFPSPVIEYEYVWMKHELFYAVLILDGLVLLFCLCCVAAIFFFKKHLTLANTGLNVIYLFIAGCILSLLSLPLFGIDSELTSAIKIPDACMVRIWLLSIGFTVSVGMLIIRVVYATLKELQKDIKASPIPVSTLTISIVGLAIVDTIIVIAWRTFSPPYKSYEKKEVEYIGLRDERITLVETCTSEKESMIIAVFCFYKGGLLLLASVVTLWKRKDYEMRDQDLAQSRIALLSALFTAFVAVPVVLSLPTNPNESFAIGGVLLIFEIAFLMCWIICSKILKAYTCKKGEAVEFGKYSVQRGSGCVPCVRATYGCIYAIEQQQYGYSSQTFSDDMLNDIQEPNPEELVESTDDDVATGVGFDCKESEDVLPTDLPSHNEIDMQPYKEKTEEEEEVDEEEDNVKMDGDTSDESDRNSDSEKDSEINPHERSLSTSTVVKSSVSIYIEKSSGQETFNCGTDEEKRFDCTPESEGALTSTVSVEETAGNTESGETPARKKSKSWWKPLVMMGFLNGAKNGSEQDGENSRRDTSTTSDMADNRRSSRSTEYDDSSRDSDDSSESDSSDDDQ